MPYPTEYSSASRDFDRFLDDVKQRTMLQTRHQAWQVARGVFMVFRSYLSLAEVLHVSNHLPPLFRAMFVEGLEAGHVARPLAGADLTAEVAGVRADHQFADRDSIGHVMAALRAAMNPLDFERMLAPLAPELKAFWTG